MHRAASILRARSGGGRDSAVSAEPQDAAISESSECHRDAKSRRCSATGIESPRLRRQQKYCRSSSNAAQNRDADSKLPKPSIG